MSLKGSRGGIRSVVRDALRNGAWLGAATLAAGSGTSAAERRRPASDEQRRSPRAKSSRSFGERLEQGLGTRYTAPLLETPQTITLVPREIIDQQNLLTMRDILVDAARHHVHGGRGRRRLRRRREPSRLHRDAATSRPTACATARSTAAPIRSTSSSSSSCPAPTPSTRARARSAARSISSRRRRAACRTRFSTSPAAATPTPALTLDSEWANSDGPDVRLNLMTHQQRRAGPRRRALRALGRRAFGRVRR